MEDSYTVHRRRKAAAKRRDKTPDPPRNRGKEDEDRFEDDTVARAKMERMVEDTEKMAESFVNRKEEENKEEGEVRSSSSSSSGKEIVEKVPKVSNTVRRKDSKSERRSDDKDSNKKEEIYSVGEDLNIINAEKLDSDIKSGEKESPKFINEPESGFESRDVGGSAKSGSFKKSVKEEEKFTFDDGSKILTAGVDSVKILKQEQESSVKKLDESRPESEDKKLKKSSKDKLFVKEIYASDSTDDDEGSKQETRRNKSADVPSRLKNSVPKAQTQHHRHRSALSADSDEEENPRVNFEPRVTRPSREKRNSGKQRNSIEESTFDKRGSNVITGDCQVEVEDREAKRKLREKRSLSRHRYQSDTDDEVLMKKSETFPQRSIDGRQIIRRSASEMKKQIIPLNNESLIEDFAKAQEEYIRRERGIMEPDPRLDDYSHKGLRKRKVGVLNSDQEEIFKNREAGTGNKVGEKKSSWFSWMMVFKKKEKISDSEKTLEETNRGKNSTEKVTFFEFVKALREIVTEFKLYVAQNKRETEAIRRQRNCCIGELILIIIYCGLGAFVFRFTEGAFETFYKCGVKRVKRDFLDNLWNYSHNMREEDWKSMARRKLMEFEEQLHNAHEAGVRSYSGQKSWSFLNAIVYCLTVITTIGYGHISPRTLAGRAITIVYALFGIPMFLIILADFGKLFTRGMKFLWAFVRRLYYTGSCKKVRRTGPVQEVMKGVQLVYDFATFRRPSQMNPEEVEEIQRQQTILNLDGNMPQPETPGTPAMSHFAIDDEFNLPISVAISILLGYIFVGAVVYSELEGWDFAESFYFVFISMSTIGFGDFVPQQPLHTMILIIYLVFGLALTSMCINVVQVMLSDSFKQASQKISAHIGFEIPCEDGTPEVEIDGNPTVEISDVQVSVKEAESREEIAPKAKQEDMDL